MTETRPAAARRCLAVILAAGGGVRMKSEVPKVLHAIGGRSLLWHVVSAVRDSGADAVAVVVGPDRDDVAAEARRVDPQVRIHVQRERLGTAHAVLAARDSLAEGFDDVLVVFADTPLVMPETFRRMREALARGAAVAPLAFEAADPTGYGRMLVRDGQLVAIREHKDADEAERRVRLCNAGLMALDGKGALELLEGIGNANAQREYYLTDAVEEARRRGLSAVALVAPESEVMGVNDRVQLAQAEAILQGRLRTAAMRGGATLVAPETVFLSVDTRLGRDVLVEPHVVFGPGVTVDDGAVIHSFSHLEGAHVGPGATVGPFGRLRPGADLGPKAKIGNFVEVKSAQIGAGAKVSHLTYLGDASVGANANIGAGTITCNYDGFRKFRTEIGDNAFIGSNSALVAPVRVGAGAFVGSGSVITDDVPADALALGRGRQVVKEGWAVSFRERQPKKARD
ncbi:bifunctional UDP-N-acetylglucosamine diphosphorylase/glucosamine-1-phosphate N-acetyltransferase GlmU [Alsobacter sp. SYSU M60028]|uniref:Bifunctional protein GlmU n=1 Tax=Alsobacter ponti TaxID=2962936 RepID=A0ABT1LEM6_9HYPH|nr:bifunctional UDP-N-acetylglucosamine diphosphorylase/glucosamine-1-phosphate N-acetyltransferase GlmU [Alsobacter ponti]MCP8939381.1 bifunctional UDP-N-acetylglucosamine diphosphorylase/glucosamine-1-phosphate N-acetyltransferase GlmU [Alsobacter ponti]